MPLSWPPTPSGRQRKPLPDAAQAAADRADIMTCDIDLAAKATDIRRRGEIDHLRAEIPIRRSIAPIELAIQNDMIAARVALEKQSVELKAKIEKELRALEGFGFLWEKDFLNRCLGDALVNQNSRLVELHERQRQLSLMSVGGGQNVRDLHAAEQRLRALLADDKGPAAAGFGGTDTSPRNCPSGGAW